MIPAFFSCDRIYILIFCFSSGSFGGRTVFPFVKFLQNSIIGTLGNIRQIFAPGFCCIFKAFFESVDQKICFFRIVAGKGFCKIKDTVRGLLYTPVAVLSDICLSLFLCFLINGKVTIC